MVSGGVRVEGLNRVVRQLKELGLDVSDLKDAFANLAQDAARAVERHTPKRSGKLASSIRGNRAQSKAVVRAGKAAVPYAGAINYGWPKRNIAPALFMQQGDAELQPVAIHQLEQGIEQAIKKRQLR